MAAPLAGIKVIEVANFLAAPCACALMSDMGAEVIKVEPPGGDAMRFSKDRTPFNSAMHLDNRGKRSITLDLTKPSSREVMRRLIGEADIFVTNLIGRRQKQYSLTPADLFVINPRLVHASLTGYGAEGPGAERPGFDSSAYWANSGIMALMGGPDDPPPISRGGQGDHVATLNLLVAILSALRLRDTTGQPQTVDVTLIGTGVWTLSRDVVNTLITGKQPERIDRTQPDNPLRNHYRCSDGRWIVLTMPQSDRYWATFCRVVEHPEWENDPKYDSLDSRMTHSKELTLKIDAAFATATMAEWTERLGEAGLIFGPVAELPEVTNDEVLRSLGAFTTLTHQELGEFETVATPFQIKGADIYAKGPAPLTGEHTHEALLEAGFSADEIASFAEEGTFG